MSTKAPKQIKYQGQLYVLAATEHKKCPRGEHWSEESGHCAKVVGKTSSGKHVFEPHVEHVSGLRHGPSPRAKLSNKTSTGPMKLRLTHSNDFTPQDHKEAAKIHKQQAAKWSSKGLSGMDMADAHHDLAYAHASMAQSSDGAMPSFSAYSPRR